MDVLPIPFLPKRGCTALKGGKNVKDKYELKGILDKVSECMMHLDNQELKEKFPVSLLDINSWEWPQGVGLSGLIRYAINASDQKILSFVENWFDAHMPETDKLEKNVNSTCPMLALTYLYDIKPKAEYKELIKKWADWVMDPQGLIRTGDGCMQHMITGDPNPDQLLIDTLFMTVLFLIRAGKLLNRPDMISEANYQIIQHIRYLFDIRAGLFYHGWTFRDMNNYGEVHWLRGNCWYTVGCMDFILEQEDIPDEIKRVYLSVLMRQVLNLKKYQDSDEGLWHTVIEDPASYIELSGSCGVLYGIMKAIRYGFLSKEEYFPVIRKGINHVFDYIDDNGAVLNVSYGTPIGENKEFYMNIPCYIMTYGQAMMILLLEEMLNDYWQDIG